MWAPKFSGRTISFHCRKVSLVHAVDTEEGRSETAFLWLRSRSSVDLAARDSAAAAVHRLHFRSALQRGFRASSQQNVVRLTRAADGRITGMNTTRGSKVRQRLYLPHSRRGRRMCRRADPQFIQVINHAPDDGRQNRLSHSKRRLRALKVICAVPHGRFRAMQSVFMPYP